MVAIHHAAKYKIYLITYLFRKDSHEREHLWWLLTGLLVQYPDPQGHEGSGEVDARLPFRCHCEITNGQIGSLKRKRKSIQKTAGFFIYRAFIPKKLSQF